MNTHSAPLAVLMPVYLKLAGVSMIWGGTFVAGRFLAGHFSPLLLASLRFSLASLVLLAFIGVARVPLIKPTRGQWMHLLILSFFGIFLYNLCFFYGLNDISASRASLIVALNPAFIGLASWLLFKEHPGMLRGAGIALGVTGALVVIASGNPALAEGEPVAGVGDVLILGCVLSWAVYSLYSRKLTRELGALQTVTCSIVLGTGLLWLTTLIKGEASLTAIDQLNGAQWLSLGYLGALGSALAYIGYYQGIERIGATRAGVFIALNPLTAVLLGALLLEEHLTLGMGLGGLLILSGIYLCNRSPSAK